MNHAWVNVTHAFLMFKFQYLKDVIKVKVSRRMDYM